MINLKKLALILLGGILFCNSANAEVRTYEGYGEYVMSDFETPDVAKQRAKQRAESSAQEQAGIFVRSNVKVVNAQMESEEIEVLTAGIMKVHSVTYEVVPDVSGFVFKSKVLVDIDTDEIDKWLAENAETKAELVEKNTALQNALNEQEKQLAELKAKLADLEKNNSLENSPELKAQITQEFNKSSNKFLSNERLKVGMNLHMQGDLRGAIDAYTEAIEYDSDNAMAYTWRGNALGSLNQYQNAEHDFVKALKLNNQNLNAYLGLGIAYYYSGKYDVAIAALNQAISVDSQSGLAYYVRACCYRAMKMNQEAQQDFSVADRLGYRQ